jgi:hypothetical protein
MLQRYIGGSFYCKEINYTFILERTFWLIQDAVFLLCYNCCVLLYNIFSVEKLNSFTSFLSTLFLYHFISWKLTKMCFSKNFGKDYSSFHLLFLHIYRMPFISL